jgi:2-aminobenzoate-CoA ligase
MGTADFMRSGHVDTFARDNLPPRESWPRLDLAAAGLSYPERLNVVTEFVDRHVAEGRGERDAVIGPSETWSYQALAEMVNRIANVLTRDLGMVAGNRVLLRAANTPMMVATYFAVLKAGGVVVATMPMLRAGELAYPIRKAKIGLALCDATLVDELKAAQRLAPELSTIVTWGDGALETMMDKAGYEHFEPAGTAQDDVCLIAFTSGTTGEPKGTMHFQRDQVHPLARQPARDLVGHVAHRPRGGQHLLARGGRHVATVAQHAADGHLADARGVRHVAQRQGSAWSLRCHSRSR